MPASLDLYLSAPSITATPSIDLKDTNGSTVFRIITHTPSGTSGGTSTLSRIRSDKDSGVSLAVMVGIIEWRSVGRTVFCTGDGENRSIDDYLPRQGSMSRVRAFVSRHGRGYTWTPNKKSLELVRDDGIVVVRASHGSNSLFGKRRLPQITIFETCFEDVDEIILTYIYIQRMEERRKDSEQQHTSFA